MKKTFLFRILFLLPTALAAAGAPPPTDAGDRTDPFTAVCFHPDMKSFAAGTQSGKILKWSMETGNMKILNRNESDDEISQMAFSQEGQWLWWLRRDTLYRCNFAEFDRKETVETGVTTFAFSTTGKYLAIGKQDGKVIILSPEEPNYKKELNPEKPGPVNALAFSRSEKRIASSGSTGLIVRDIQSALIYRRLGGDSKKQAGATVMMFSPNDQYLVSGYYGLIQLWDVFDGKARKSSTGVKGIHTLTMSPDKRNFFAGGEKGIFSLNLESLTITKSILCPANGQVRLNEAKCMDVSADGLFLLQGCLDGAARLWYTQYDGALLTFAMDYTGQTSAVMSSAGAYYSERNSSIPPGLIYNYISRPEKSNPDLVKQVLQQIEPEKSTKKEEELIDRAGKDYALFFVTGDYQEWSKLKNPVTDGEAIVERLAKKYGFQTEVLINPTRDQIYTQLEKYRTITFPEDGQLFVFFSGHGEFTEATGEGFIVPKEGLKSDKDRFQNSYIPHSRLEKMLDAIPCRHLLVAIDACYSGTFDEEIAELKGETDFKRPGSGSKSALIQRELEAPSRIYLTSGGKERTPDGVSHSPFAEKLLDALDGEGGDDGILTVNELYVFLEKANPQPRKGRFGKHDPKGTFLFVSQNKD